MTVFVFIGTIAELIKTTPVILSLRNDGVKVVGIATGQNNLSTSDLFTIAFPDGIENQITYGPGHPTPTSLAFWFLRCFTRAPFALRKVFKATPVEQYFLIVHGDTLSTLLGAFAGWLVGGKIVHLEAGLRSFQLLRPFPEEICRRVVTCFTTVAFCPGEWAMRNLARAKITKKINTEENTLLDAMRLALEVKCLPEIIPAEKFCLIVLHRQENLLDQSFVRYVVTLVEEISEKISCVMILHEPFREVLKSLDLLERVLQNTHIKDIPRQPYISFTHILEKAEYVLTDGGSNQEECYYLGKPCLLLRQETERQEGLGKNVVLSKKENSTIQDFLLNPLHWKSPPFKPTVFPSKLVAKTLKNYLKNARS